MGSLLGDFRSAVRGLGSSPALSLAVVATLGIGIASATLVFSVVDAVLIRQLPLPDAERLVRIYTHAFGSTRSASSEANLLDYRSRVPSLESVAGFQYQRLHLGSGEEPQTVLGISATPELFDVLQIRPTIGRPFTLEDAQPGSIPSVAVISYRLWQRLFSGSGQAIGSEIVVEGLKITVIGVMPSFLRYPHPEVDLWYPLAIDPASPTSRTNHMLGVVGRVHPDVSLARVVDEVQAYGELAVNEFPANYATFDFGVEAVPLRDAVVGSARGPLLMLLGAVSLVMLIACANVASLLLVRTDSRRRDLALRSALGAPRWKVLSLVLTESLVLALLGCAFGIALAASGRTLLLAQVADGLPRADEVALDLRVLLAAVAVSVFAGLLAALAPALSALRTDAGRLLTAAGRSMSVGPNRQRLRRGLVGAQVALAVILVVGAGLMIRSVGELLRVDLGLAGAEVVTARVSLPRFASAEGPNLQQTLIGMVDRVTAMPAVDAAGITTRLPVASGFGRWSIQVEGHEAETIGAAPVTHLIAASSGALRAIGIRVSAGRLLRGDDLAGRRWVGVVNETFQRRVFQGRDAIGARVALYDDENRWIEIVGVIEDIRHQGPEVPVHPLLIVPYAQADEVGVDLDTSAILVARSTAVDQPVAATICTAAREVDPSAVVDRVRTLADVQATVADDRRLPLLLLGAFGVLALLLAAMGIVGIVSLAVRMREREIGIRLALGGAIRAIRTKIVVDGLTPVVTGLVVGIVFAALAARLLGGLLFNVVGLDPPTLVGTVLTLAAVGIVAALIPTLRVGAIDPARLLRDD